nr:hypothetical protein [Abalone asfa-like virus]
MTTIINPQEREDIEKLINDFLSGKLDKVCITGPPGSGKTTYIRQFLDFETKFCNKNVAPLGEYKPTPCTPSICNRTCYPFIVTPTNMAKSLYCTATTLHERLLELKQCSMFINDIGMPRFSMTPLQHECPNKHNPTTPCSCDLNKGLTNYTPLSFAGIANPLVLDEFSMVSRDLILSAKRIMIIGDLNQLEPVGGASLTHEDLEQFTVYTLKNNYRVKTPEMVEVFTQALIDPMKQLYEIPTIRLDQCYERNIPILTWRNNTAYKYQKKTFPKPYIFMGRYAHPISNVVIPNGTITTISKPRSAVTVMTSPSQAITAFLQKGGKVYKFITKDFGEIYTYDSNNLYISLKEGAISKETFREYMMSTGFEPASAFTVHKAQGQTFENIAIDRRDMEEFYHMPFYSKKHTYVALTRGRNVFCLV